MIWDVQRKVRARSAIVRFQNVMIRCPTPSTSHHLLPSWNIQQQYSFRCSTTRSVVTVHAWTTTPPTRTPATKDNRQPHVSPRPPWLLTLTPKVDYSTHTDDLASTHSHDRAPVSAARSRATTASTATTGEAFAHRVARAARPRQSKLARRLAFSRRSGDEMEPAREARRYLHSAQQGMRVVP